MTNWRRTSTRRLMAAAAAAMLGTGAFAQPAPPSDAAQTEADRKRLAEALGTAVKPLVLDNGRLDGAGGAWLADKLRGTDILMIGETHGTGSIAQTAGLLVDALPTDRPLAYALEIGPAAAAIQEPLLRGPADKLESYMADPRRAISYAFLNLREEAVLAQKIFARADRKATSLWGLDQEFATAAPLLLDRLEQSAGTATQKAAIATARTQMAPLMAMTTVPDSVYDPLDSAFASGPKAAQQLLADMRFSSGIYRTQETASNQSNRQREDYMKRNFISHWRAAGKHPPRVVMKFGAYHLTAGLSPTMTPALGSFVNALALMDGQSRFSVMIVCGPDGEQIDYRGQIHPCTEDFEEVASLFKDRLQPGSATLVDTAPLRLIPGTLKRQGASEDIRNYIQSYDAIIILRGAKAGTPFAPPPASFFEGM